MIREHSPLELPFETLVGDGNLLGGATDDFTTNKSVRATRSGKVVPHFFFVLRRLASRCLMLDFLDAPNDDDAMICPKQVLRSLRSKALSMIKGKR